MSPKYRPPCPHRCCVDDTNHEHAHTVAECPDCAVMAESHPLARRALEIAEKKRSPR